MRDTLNEYLEKFKENSKKHKKMISVFFMLALIVAVGVTWRLKLIGVSMTNEVYCGKEEHIHTADCYRIEEASSVTDDDVIVATSTQTDAISDDGAGGDEVIPEGYVKILVCGKEEHIHTMACMSDESADLETEDDWNALVNTLNLNGESYVSDLLAIADSQIGYSESIRNFIVRDNETSKNGITRYGQWYGNPYGNWNAMFVAFCLNYAGVDSTLIPYNSGVEAWVVDLKKAELYKDASEYTPVAGDIAFVDNDRDGIADGVGIVKEIAYDIYDGVTITGISLIQGDVADISDDNGMLNVDADEEIPDSVQVVQYIQGIENAAVEDGSSVDENGNSLVEAGDSIEVNTNTIDGEMQSGSGVEISDDLENIEMQTDDSEDEKYISKIIGYVSMPVKEVTESPDGSGKVIDETHNVNSTDTQEQTRYCSSQVKKYDAPSPASGDKRIYFDVSNSDSWWLTSNGWGYISVYDGTGWSAWTMMEQLETDKNVFWYDIKQNNYQRVRFGRGTNPYDGNIYGYTVETTKRDIETNDVDCYAANSGWQQNSSNGGTWVKFIRYPVYYDATMSKVSYDTAAIDSSLPRPNETVYYHAWNSDSDIQDGECALLEPYTSGDNEWKDIYVADLKKQYAKIIFYSSADGTWPNDFPPSKTGDLTINWSLTSPCFYGDTSDKIIYYSKDDKLTRSGYWAELYTIRNVETGKGAGTDIVPIATGSFDESAVEDGSIFYMNATFYDYYSDYELNGTSKATYDVVTGGSHRAYVNFRQFDQALSDYYNSASVVNTSAIYTGHFQPDIFDDSRFSKIADTLNLYGWSNYATFMAVNNSNLDINRNQGKYDSAAVGIVDDELTNGDLTISTEGGGHVLQPHFNKEFINGNNSKNAIIGEIYENVAFPFIKTRVFNDTGDSGEYYWFDSARTTLQLKKNLNTDSKFGYYLDGAPFLGSSSSSYNDDDRKNWALNVNYMGNNNGASSGGSNDEISRKFGFFPFNNVDGNENGNCASKYNYGFGTKLSFSFKIPENGTVDNTPGGRPIRFRFSGDDDVWIFVDGQLALDLGGGHGQVQGMIDFSGTSTEKYAYISKVKDIDSSNTAYNQGWEEISPVTLQYLYGENKDGNNHGNGDSTTVTEYYNYRRSFNLSGSNTDVHTVTVFYMERGLWESNFSMVFNFPTVKSDPYTLPETGGSGTNMLIYGGIAILLLGYLYYRCVFKQFNGERRKV